MGLWDIFRKQQLTVYMLMNITVSLYIQRQNCGFGGCLVEFFYLQKHAGEHNLKANFS